MDDFITQHTARNVLKWLCKLAEAAAKALHEAACYLHDAQGQGEHPHQLLAGPQAVLTREYRNIEETCQGARQLYQDLSADYGGSLSLKFCGPVESRYDGHPIYLMEEASKKVSFAIQRVGELRDHAEWALGNPHLTVPDAGAELITEGTRRFIASWQQQLEELLGFLQGSRRGGGVKALIEEAIQRWQSGQ
jgi:hypothetical protein